MTSNQLRDLSADHGARVHVGDHHIQTQTNTDNSTYHINVSPRIEAVNHNISNAGPSSITNIHHYNGPSAVFHRPQSWDRWDKELFEAARRDDYSRAANYLAKRNPRPDAEAYRDHKGRTSLHWAVKNDNSDMVKLLIDEFGAWKETPQARADRFPSSEGHAETSANFLAEKRHTPLFIAAWRLASKKTSKHNGSVTNYLITQGCSLTRAAFCAADDLGTLDSGQYSKRDELQRRWMNLQSVFIGIVISCGPQKLSSLEKNELFVGYHPWRRTFDARSAAAGRPYATDWKLKQSYPLRFRDVASPVLSLTVLELCALRHEQHMRFSFGIQPLHRHLRDHHDLQTIATAEMAVIQTMSIYQDSALMGKSSALGVALANRLAEDIITKATESERDALEPILRQLFVIFESESLTDTRRKWEVLARDKGWNMWW